MPTITYHECVQCGLVRPRAVTHTHDNEGAHPYHDPTEGGCGHPITTTHTERGDSPDPGLTDQTTTPQSARFQLSLSRADGQLTATLGGQTFTNAHDLWQALDANLIRASTRRAERQAKLDAERQAELKRIDEAIADGRMTTAEAKLRPRKSSPGPSADLDLSDLGL